MNVVPNTPITSLSICKGIPLDNTYRDTLGFSSVSQQTAYYAGKAKYTWNDLTPVRMQNRIRVPVAADMIYDCNYIMFSNRNFNEKKFYAFIIKIDYVSANMCEILFEIDVMQTWFFNIIWHPCFVEREHIQVDDIGANLVEENLELGDYEMGEPTNSGGLDKLYICMATTVDANLNNTKGGIYGGIYSGVQYLYFENPETVNDAIATLTEENKANAIVAIFMIPELLCIGKNTSPWRKDFYEPKDYNAFGDYIPKNAKLWTYPYNFLHVTDYSGQSNDYRYEDFSDAVCRFSAFGATSPDPEIIIYPRNYKGVESNYIEKVVMGGYPQCAYNIDSYKEWFAKNGLATAISTAGQSMSAAKGLLAGNTSGLTGVLGSLARVSELQTEPPSAHGSSGSASLVAGGIKDLWFIRYKIKEEYARIIDGYFSMYGYATKEVKVPNITGRESWNYVKTVGCNVTGNISFDDLAKIRSIVDNGITFWHNTDVGNYDLDNNPVGES